MKLKLLILPLLFLCISENILAANCDTPLNATLQTFSGGSASFTWSAVIGSTGYEYVVDQSSTNPMSGIVTTSLSCTVPGLISSTQYYFHLRTKCSTDSSDWVLVPFLTPLCPSIAQIGDQGIGATYVNLGWGPGNNGTPFMYGVSTTPTPPNPGTYVLLTPVITVSGLNPNTHYYVCVRRICGVADTSAWNCSYSFTTNAFPASVTNSEFDSIFLRAYPNPIASTLAVSVEGKKNSIGSIQLTDVTGKLINTYTMEGTQMNIDMSGLSSGVYFLRYADNEHRQTIKINKD